MDFWVSEPVPGPRPAAPAYSLSFSPVHPMNLDGFVESLHRKPTNICGMFATSTVKQAKECVRHHREKDGLICHHFSGQPSEYMTAGARHSFMVVPGVWARAIIRNFDSKFLRGPSLATEEEKKSEEFTRDFKDGVYGVIFEMSFSDALSKLNEIDCGLSCRYRLVRFVLQEYSI